MTLTPAQQRAIIARESAWIDDGQFAPLDLSGFPALNELPPEKGRDDDRFAKHWNDTPLSASATALRNFVLDPDSASLERVGQEIGNQGFRDEVRQRKGESVAARFKSACPDYLPTDANYDMIAETLAFNALPDSEQGGDTDEIVAKLIDSGHWTIANLRACFLALQEEGLLEVPMGSTRALSTAERLRVTRLAQSGRVDAAIGDYLKCALNGEEPGMELLDNPVYREAATTRCGTCSPTSRMNTCPRPNAKPTFSGTVPVGQSPSHCYSPRGPRVSPTSNAINAGSCSISTSGPRTRSHRVLRRSTPWTTPRSKSCTEHPSGNT
jgi:hypothetical protein